MTCPILERYLKKSSEPLRFKKHLSLVKWKSEATIIRLHNAQPQSRIPYGEIKADWVK
jgi:hypothetical protein